jgi:hypothetical protein
MKPLDILTLTLYSPAILFALLMGALIWLLALTIYLSLRFLETCLRLCS